MAMLWYKVSTDDGYLAGFVLILVFVVLLVLAKCFHKPHEDKKDPDIWSTAIDSETALKYQSQTVENDERQQNLYLADGNASDSAPTNNSLKLQNIE